nr:Spy/CpxP family protein refolding chaperone [Phenylobacterium glaciei]
MMAGGMMNMADMHGLGMSAHRLAALKDELALTPAQLPLWEAFADASQAMNVSMPMHAGMEMPEGKPMAPGTSMPQGMAKPKPGTAMMTAPVTLPERLDRHEAMMTERLDALRKVKAALSPLYAALGPAQRTKLDAMPAHPQKH